MLKFGVFADDGAPGFDRSNYRVARPVLDRIPRAFITYSGITISSR